MIDSFTAAELQGREFPPTKWALRGLLAVGVNVLVGAPKVGKSWWALLVAIAIAAGSKALGSIAVDQGDVLYLALEDTDSRLQKRLRILMGSEDFPERLTFVTDWPNNTEGFEFVDDWLDRHPDARLVVVDVLHKVRPQTATNQSAYAQDYGVMDPMVKLSRKYGVAFLVVHHTRKAVAEDFLDAVSGTNGIAGSADAVLVLARARTAADGTLSVTGRDVEESTYALEAEGGYRWQMLEGPASDYELSDTRRAILEAVRRAGTLTPKTCANVIGGDHENVKKAMQRMAIDGQLVVEGAGRYSVPPDPLSPMSPQSPKGQEGPKGQVHLEVVPDAT